MWVDPFEHVIKLKGTVDEDRLKLTVRSGEASESAEVYLPADALMGDTLSPQTQLPGLRAGQTWKVQAYNPLHPFKNRPELLQATVEGIQPLRWGDRWVDAWLVVYRSDSGFRLGGNQTPRGRLWVRRDGTVLIQEMMIFGSTMTFRRLPNDQAAELEEKAHDTP